MEIINAQIKSTFLGREDHGILTFYLECDSDGLCRNVGGYFLEFKDKETRESIYDPRMMGVIAKILDVVGVKSWEELKGKYIRLKVSGGCSPCYEIGHIIKDKWLNFPEHFGGK